MRTTILAASVTALLAFVSTAMMATAMATAEAAAATEAQDIAQEDSAFKLDLHRFFPQYRAVPSKLILQADVTRVSSSTENKFLGAASGALGCLFSDPSDPDCYKASASLGTNIALSSDEMVQILEEGFASPDERLEAFGEYLGRIDDQVADLVKAVQRVHTDGSRQFAYLKDLIAGGDATSYELYKNAEDYRVNLELMQANLQQYQQLLPQATQAMYTLARGNDGGSQSKAAKFCDGQLSRLTFRVNRLADLTETYQEEYDLLNFAAMTQEVREDEGYTPNFLYMLMDQAERAADKLHNALNADGDGDNSDESVYVEKSEPQVAKLSADELQQQQRQSQEDHTQIMVVTEADRQQFQDMKSELQQLRSDSEKLQKQLAYYESAMQVLRNQLDADQKLLAELQDQKQQLQQQSAAQNSLSSEERQKLKSYELYIAQLEKEIEEIRSSYLAYDDYRNVLDIEVR